MNANWFILADDLTGAADSAVAFAERGIDTWVTWKDGVSVASQARAVIAYNSASRELTPAAAITAQRAALDKFFRPGTTLFKKIDSTLRGQPAVEIRMVCDFLQAQRGSAFGIVAPAFPALGRTTLNSNIYIDGERLEQTELWAREHTYSTANMLDILTSVGLSAEGISLVEVRGGHALLVSRLRRIASSSALAVCDAVTEQDLDCINAATRALNIEYFYVGSGGLARALAGSCDAAQREIAANSMISLAGALIVVGSLASASRAAARELAGEAGVKYLPLKAEVVTQEYRVEERERFVADAIAAIEAGQDALVEIVFATKPDPAAIPNLVQKLSSLIAPCASKASAIAATGGETAAALLESLNTTGIEIIAEIDPGICLGMTIGATRVPVVTKAGAFGDERSLIRVTERLRNIRNTGRLQ
jgi:D-threonate/D-erythronate kinase